MKFSTFISVILVNAARFHSQSELIRGVSAASLRGNNNNNRVLIQEEQGTFVLGIVEYESNPDGNDDDDHSEEILNVDLPDGLFELKGVPPGFLQRAKPRSGIDTIKIPSGASKNGRTIDLNNQDPIVVSGDNGAVNLFNRRRLLASTGDKKVLVVRVVANDASHENSESVLGEKWFGTDGDSNVDAVNLKSQYAACSHNQLNLIGSTTTVNLNKTITGATKIDVRGYAVEALGNYKEVYDHVALCLPPGTETGASANWVAIAYIDYEFSMHNNKYCTQLSVQMHEVGHSLLNLDHSGTTGNANSLDDHSGMMGISYGIDGGPLMCYNNAKNWQLNWFDNAKMTVDGTSSYSGPLKGQVNYIKDAIGQSPVVIKVVGVPNLYVGFNHRALHNSGTREGGDQVTIQEYTGSDETTFTSYKPSKLVAKLNANGVYVADAASVTVNSVNTTTGIAEVTILNCWGYKGGGPCNTAHGSGVCQWNGGCKDYTCGCKAVKP